MAMVMDSMVYPPTGPMATEREMSTTPMPRRGMAHFTFTLGNNLQGNISDLHRSHTRNVAYQHVSKELRGRLYVHVAVWDLRPDSFWDFGAL